MRFLLFSFVFFTSLIRAQNYPQGYFRSPLDIELVLSGSFGELRNNHFHSGLDFKTEGREGLNVYAAAEGRIVRIKVSAHGNGNSLYMAHPNGYTTVYLHLQKFAPEIDAWVKAQQYAKKSFEIDITPPDIFTYKKGDVIALSGNSGGSGGPHLHFEIRDTKTEEIIDPVLFGLPIKDSRKPMVSRLLVAPQTAGGRVNGSNTAREINLSNQGNGVYTGAFTASGQLGLLLGTFDQQDAATNNNGVNRIEQWVNDTLTYCFAITRFAFDATRYVNAHIDFGRYKTTKQQLNKLFVEPGNKFPAYTTVVNRGLISATAGKTKKVLLKIYDSWGNQTEVRLTITGVPETTAAPEPKKLLRWDVPNTLKATGITVTLPAGTLYKDEEIAFLREEPCAKCASPQFVVGAKTIAAHKRYDLAIHKDQLKKTDRVVWATEGGSGLTSTWQGDWLVAHPREFGRFAVRQDTVAPSLTGLNLSNGAIVKKGGRLRFVASDALSGLTFYQATIDGQWVLLTFDGKNNLFWHDFEENLAVGNHVFEITLKDEVGNETQRKINFSYQP